MGLLTGKRIFVIEDDLGNMVITAEALRQHGATVLQDQWNSNSVELLSYHLPVDVVLLDLMLNRGLSGYDVFQEIKAEAFLQTIPVVAVSASDPAVEIPKAQAMGFAGFIGKPISLQLFPRQIAACINGEEVWHFGY